MKLDRNIQDDGLGKYALINLRKLNAACGRTLQRWTPAVEAALKTLEEAGALEWGYVGDPDEFFLLKLKDVNAMATLMAYHASIYKQDPEFAKEVKALALRSGPLHPLCKDPD